MGTRVYAASIETEIGVKAKLDDDITKINELVYFSAQTDEGEISIDYEGLSLNIRGSIKIKLEAGPSPALLSRLGIASGAALGTAAATLAVIAVINGGTVY